MSRKEYISWILVVVIPVIFFGFCEYKNYSPIKEGLDSFTQFSIILAICIGNILLSVFITIRRFRNSISILFIYLITLAGFLLPYGYQSMLRVIQTRLRYVFVFPIVLFVMRGIHIFARHIPKEKDFRRIIKIRFEKLAYVIWQSYSIVIILMLGANILWKYVPSNLLYKYNMPIHVAKSDVSASQYLEQNKQLILKICDEWDSGKLDRKEN